MYSLLECELRTVVTHFWTVTVLLRMECKCRIGQDNSLSVDFVCRDAGFLRLKLIPPTGKPYQFLNKLCLMLRFFYGDICVVFIK